MPSGESLPTGTDVLMAAPPCMICKGEGTPAEYLAITDMGRAYLCREHTDQYGRREEETWPVMLWARTQPALTERQARRYVAAQTYTASEYGGPHEYVQIWKSTDPAMQMRVLQHIRVNGELRERGKSRYHYWAAGDGHEYWALAETETILNRDRPDAVVVPLRPEAATEE
jgi:hypothetical protein